MLARASAVHQVTVAPTATLQDAAQLMLRKKARHNGAHARCFCTRRTRTKRFNDCEGAD
jgi:hypothetical protein